MAGTTENGANQIITGINVTPLVDVVLVLLIIFMATAPLIHRRALNVNVPRAAHTEPKATETLQVQYTALREVFIEKTAYRIEELGRELRGRLRLEPALHVSVSADQTIPYGDVVGLLDVIRGAGVKKVALDVRRK
ncbi:MAG: biopolymer transporter ExbD [Elusimicrobia bacterium]|nr:biopolymer transporter ExbD [Elusimicrobiota bacterium]